MRRIVLLACKIGCVIMVLMMVSAAALSAEQEIKTGNEHPRSLKIRIRIFIRIGRQDEQHLLSKG